MAVDLEMLLAEVRPEAPCGEDLSYDPAFLALEDMLRARPAGIVEGADEAGEEPNWPDVRDRSLELLGRSKDLRTALSLTLALLMTEGLSGLSDGLSLIEGLLERHWSGLYPVLDTEDNDDPLERMNVLQALSPAGVSEQDAMRFKQRVAAVPLCNSTRMGRFSLRDIQRVRGEIAPGANEGAPMPSMDLIDAAFQDTAGEELEAAARAASDAIDHATAISTLFSQQASEGQTPDLSGFQKVLGQVHKCLQNYLSPQGVESAEPNPGSSDDPAEKGVPLSAAVIRSADEAILAIEKVCQYFERHEPSSPVPLLLRRAQRLVSKNFLDVVQDVCPDVLDQIQKLGGISDSDSG